MENIYSHEEHVHTSVTCNTCGAMICADEWSMEKHEAWHKEFTQPTNNN